MNRFAIFIYCISWLLAGSSDAADLAVKQTLAGTPPAELPTRAAMLIQEAKPRQRESVTLDVVKAAVEINPASAAPIVSAVAKILPDNASTAAGVAAAVQPKQDTAIAQAAALAAPAKAGKIVVAVCRAVPGDHRNIALVVARAVPGSAKEIVAAAGTALPELKAGIEQALSASTNSSRREATLGPQSPSPLPPSSTVTNVTPATNGLVRQGGRGPATP